jgi:hypothetical protein
MTLVCSLTCQMFLVLAIICDCGTSYLSANNGSSHNHISTILNNECHAILETRLLPPPNCSKTKYLVKNLLITGSARSGTTMIAKLISALFFRISQDSKAPTPSGMVSWELATKPMLKCSDFWGSNINCATIRFRHVFHQVRNPLTAIRSMLTEYSHWQAHPEIIRTVIPQLNLTQSPAYLALQVWVEWNSHLDKYPFIPIHRVEDLNLFALMSRAGWNVKTTHPHVSGPVMKACYHMLKGHNKREQSNTSQFTWNLLFSIDPALAARAREMATRYGYTYYANDTLKFPSESHSSVSELPVKGLSSKVASVLAKCKSAAKSRQKGNRTKMVKNYTKKKGQMKLGAIATKGKPFKRISNAPKNDYTGDAYRPPSNSGRRGTGRGKNQKIGKRRAKKLSNSAS